MQVATLFRDNVILLGAANTMNTTSESTLASLEEEEEETTKISTKDTHNDANDKLPLSVSSLMSLASTALLGNASSVRTEDISEENAKNEDEQNNKGNGEKEENEKEENKEEGDFLPMEESVIDSDDNPSNFPSNDENDIDKQANANLNDNVAQSPYDGTPVAALSPPSLELEKEEQCEIAAAKSSPSPAESSSLVASDTENKTFTFDDCEASSHHVPSSQPTALLLEEDESSFKKAFMPHEENLPESGGQTQIQTSSSLSPSNIIETHGCATNNISDIEEMEAENLVIHQHDHSSSVPRKTSTNDHEMEHLLHPPQQKEQCDEVQEMDTGDSLEQHAHQQQQQQQQQQLEFEHQQHLNQQQQQQHLSSQQRLPTPEERNEVIDNCAKHDQYSHVHQFPECLRNDLNVDEISHQQNIRDQQMTQNALDPNVEDYRKMQHLPPNMNIINQIDQQQQQQHQYHHLNQNQHQLQHQHPQQLYLQQQQQHHHDQQQMLHHHQQQQQQQQQQQHQQQQQQHQQQQQQQQQHHSELMAYLHHQDQQAMQQPHHIRTYQQYQQQQQRIHQLPHPQPPSPHHHQQQQQQQQQKHAAMTCIDDLMIDEFHEDPNNRYKLLSPTVKHESQDDGYETSAGDVLTPNSHSSSHSMTPQHQIHSTNLVPPKSEDMSTAHHTDPDPYNFIDDEINSNIRMMSPSSSNGISMVLRQQTYGSPSEAPRLPFEDVQSPIRMGGGGQHIVDANNALRMQVPNTDNIAGDITIPKKRGRKKKCADELAARTMVDGILKPILQKERKKHDRFNGMPEEEVSKRTLPDHLADNLDIIIIGINPGLFAAYKGHHYAGPGNHFWKCLYLSGLTHEQMTAEEDYKLLKFGIGFTNMVERATKGSADLTRKEIKEGSRILLEKLKRFRPKIAVFNGKLIFEVFSGKKDFNFGRQQECVEGTDTYMWVMPSSSARCAQLPRAADKVPFYAALKKFRDYLNGLIPHIDDLEFVFNDPKSKQCCDTESKDNASPVAGPFLAPDCLNSENQSLGYNNSNSSTPERGSITDLSTNLNNNNSMNIMHKESPMHPMIGSGDNNGACGMVMPGINGPTPMNLCSNVMHMPCSLDQSGQPEKKKRGRPKKVKGMDGEEGPVPQKVRNTNTMMNSNNNILNLTLMGENGETPKKKRGRPKKIKTDTGSNANIGPNIASNSNSSSNNGNPMDSATKTDLCLHRNSPSGMGSQLLAMNNGNQFNAQTLSQQQPLQNQRLFTSPMHSPNTVSSYCPIGMNAPTTPPTGNTNSNNSNLGSSGAYHQQQQQQHANSHNMQHNHVLQQRVQHQLHIPPGMYMPSPNHNPQQSSKSPHYGSSHSDLSTEISAAISSEHLGESQSASSPAMGPVDYDRPDSIPNDEHSGHDLRFASPASNTGDPQQGSGGPNHQIQQHYHNLYQNPSSNQAYLSANNNAVLGSTPSETGGNNSNDDSINYMVSSRPHTSNSNTSTPQPAQIQPQQRNLQLSDVTSKSLSGLESLVDQIPTVAEGETPNSLNTTIGSIECRIKSDSNEGYPSPASGGSGAGSSISGGIGCIYIPSYSNLNSSSSSSPSSAPPSNSSILSPHHYPDPIYSTATTCPSATNTNSNNNNNNNNNNNINNYNGLASNFSVSSLTSNSYPTNSYHSNLMAAAAASSPHHITSSASGSPMYMDPHMPVAVSPIYHHPYAQHPGYGAYSAVGPPPPAPPPTLHMPSPNYPYAYTNTSGYPSQSAHHPSHTSAAGYLTNHPSMFDRIKPDIGYGGY